MAVVDLRSVYEGRYNLFRMYREIHNVRDSSDFRVKYLEISLDGHYVEIPLVALRTLDSVLDIIRINVEAGRVPELINTLVLPIKEGSYKTKRVTVGPALAGIFKMNLEGEDKWISVDAKKGNTSERYYCSYGTIVDKDFNPIFMCSWKMRKENAYSYTLIEPILRISTSCYLHKSDAMEKYIVNTLIPDLLTSSIQGISINRRLVSYNYTKTFYKPKVEIGDFPYKIKSADIPTLDTSDKQLLNLAYSNVEDMF